MADGQVIIQVDADDKAAAKRLAQLNRQIQKLESSVSSKTAKKSAIETQLAEAGARADETRQKIEDLKIEMLGMRKGSDDYNDAKVMLGELQSEYRPQVAEVNRLVAEHDRLTAKINENQQALAGCREEAGGLANRLSGGGAFNVNAAVGAMTRGINSSLKSFLRWGLGIRSTFILLRRLRSYIKEAIVGFAEYDAETKASIDGLKASLGDMKMAFGGAFAAVLNAIAPILQAIIAWVTAAANAIAAFFALLGGHGTYKRAKSGLDGVAKAAGGAGGAAEEAKKQLMGIDELNILQDDKGGGGGGGGGGDFGLEEVEISDDMKNNFENILDIVIAIGAALAGWKLGKILQSLGLLGNSFKNLLGFALGVAGAAVYIREFFDVWENGFDWQSLIAMLLGATAAVIGFGLAFGIVGAAVAALITGIGLIVLALKEWIETGEISDQALMALMAGIMLVGVALALLINPIFLVIAGFAALAVAIAARWEEVKQTVSDLKEAIKSYWEQTLADAQAQWQGIYDAVANAVNSVWDWITEKFESIEEKIKSAWETIKGILSGTLPFPHIPMPHFNIEGSFSLNPPSVPHFSVDWYAKGGIVDGATLIGAGEAGREAIIPLERNTGWIDEIAEKLKEKLGSLDVNIVLPDTVAGGLVPPSMGGGMTNELMDKLAAFLDNFGADGSGVIDIYPVVELDGMRVSKQLYGYQQRVNQMHGASLVEVT